MHDNGIAHGDIHPGNILCNMKTYEHYPSFLSFKQASTFVSASLTLAAQYNFLDSMRLITSFPNSRLPRRAVLLLLSRMTRILNRMISLQQTFITWGKCFKEYWMNLRLRYSSLTWGKCFKENRLRPNCRALSLHKSAATHDSGEAFQSYHGCGCT
ncbi:hypothetical protein K439DRAFT_185538 [Ramaria rubella]|nr:hypothetical protein K439DRAFT_185538 [Ramaria rubella]